MAKRRKEKDEEEDKPFKLPKFDEEAFMKRERRNVKTMVIAALFGMLMALVCFGFWALMGSGSSFRWALVLLVCIANAAFIKYIYARLNIDISDFTKKNWFSNYAIYFFVWLILFIILVNPPVYDDEKPYIGLAVLPITQEPGGDILIVAKITDNVGVNTDSLKMEIVDPDGNTTSLTPSEFEFDNTIVKYVYDNPDGLLGDFTYTLTANDVNGYTRQKTGDFSYDADAIDITSSRFTNLTHGDDITIEVETGISTNNFRVYYTLDDGEEINVNRKYANIAEEYETSPKYEGWNENSNYTMKVYVEVSHYFTNVLKKYSNIVEDTQIYTVTTDDEDNDIGDDTVPMPWNWSKPQGQQADVLLNYDNPTVENGPVLPYPNTVQAPGFETIIFIIALIAVVLIFKYKKKDKRKQK